MRDAKIYGIKDGGYSATLFCDDFYYEAKNCTGIAFTSSDVNKWVKMITYDNVQYFALHKFEPEVVDVEGLKKEILDEVKDYVSGSISG